MRLAALRGPEAFAIEQTELPTIAPDEVLLRVVGSGVCASATTTSRTR